MSHPTAPSRFRARRRVLPGLLVLLLTAGGGSAAVSAATATAVPAPAVTDAVAPADPAPVALADPAAADTPAESGQPLPESSAAIDDPVPAPQADPAVRRELLDAVTEVTVERTWRDSTGVYVELGMRWAAPPGVRGGDWFTLGLPEEFPSTMAGFDLRDSEGVLIARAEIADRVVTFTLDPVVEGLTEVNGWARFSMRISTTSTSTMITRSFAYNGELFELDIWIPGSSGGQAAQLTIGKRGEYLTGLGDGRTWLTWRIYTPVGPAESVTIRDLPGRGFELVCDAATLPAGAPALFRLDRYTNIPAGNSLQETIAPEVFSAACAPDGLELRLPALGMHEKYRLTVLTRVNPAYPDQLTNRAEVLLDDQRRVDSWTVQNQNSGGAVGARRPRGRRP